MIRNQIIIEQTGISYELDLFENVPLPLNKSISDVSNIANRKTDFTKTIKLPGTNNNNDIFSNIFNIARSIMNTSSTNFNPDFNPSLKANCTLYKNGIAQIKGYLQLTNIEIVDDYQIEYEIIIIGRFANLFSDIADRKLADLDLSEYNHPYTLNSIQSSWSAPIGEGYYYGLIDYGYTSNPNRFFVNQLLPQIYAKTIIDKIFSEAGFRYSSAFFNSTFFKKLVVPYSGKALRISAGEVENRLFLANRTTDSGFFNIVSNYGLVPFNNKIKDTVPPIGYDATTSSFTVRDRGKYKFVSNGEIVFKNNGPVVQFFNANIVFKKNGTTVLQTLNILNTSLAADATVSIPYSIQTGLTSVNPTDKITIEIQSFAGSYLDLQFKVLTGSNFFNQHDGGISEGDNLPISALLPNDINQTDFLSSIIKMFNLYVDIDRLDDKKLIIEPYDTFYTNNLVDLTEQVDVSRGVNISPLGALDYKSYKYTFTKDEDYLNKRHQSVFTDTYGFYGQKIENDFVKDEFVQEVIFAPRPLTKVGDKIITQIVFKDSNGNRTASPSKISLLTINPDVAFQTAEFTILSDNGPSRSFQLYPYVGHLDNPLNPSYDLNFGMPKQVYYDATKYTNSSIFNVFHKKNLEEITDPNSKIVEYYIKISDIGLNKLSFRDTYIIDKQYYRLYVLDSDLNSEEPAKVKFLKLKLAPKFIGSQQIINGGANGEDPIRDRDFQRNGNVNQFYADQTIQGNNNNIQGDKIIVNSDRNIINGEKINVLSGNDNIVSNNDVTLIGTNNYTSFRDGQTVIGGFDMPLTYTFEIDSTIVQALHESNYDIITPPEGYWIELFDMYATLLFKDLTPVGYNNHPVRIKYNGDSNSNYLGTCGSGFIARNVAVTERGTITRETVLQQTKLVLFSAGNLGTSGNGYLQIQIQYRLHQIRR